MDNTFTFNSKEFDFWPIYDCIKNYYPIGIPKNFGVGIYREYQGSLNREKLIVDNIHDSKTFEARWGSLIKKMSDDLDMKTRNKTSIQDPSFSACMPLESKQTEKNRWNYLELHYSVSLLGKFYQIYGIEKSVLSYSGDSVPYQIVNLKNVVVSPIGKFEAYFKVIEDKIRQRFKDYRPVPFSIGQSIINGLEVYHLDIKDCSINNALFHDFHGFSEQINEIEVQGDTNYGMDSWKI